MMFSDKFTALVVLTMFAFPVLAGDDPSGPVWPLDLSTRYLTSNFMEFRGGRFHAGLDLKTQSREGFTVRAVEDGYISRIRCTPTAYGRVIYLRGVSGRTYVFAHLSRFNDDLRQRVEQQQVQNETYRARLEFQPHQIPIKKGQVLGISGQSGTGGPHLHFEVRDRNQRPVNPLDHGFTISDTLPPVIHRLRAWQVNESSRINGGPGEWVLDAGDLTGLKGDQGVLNVSGPVAFSARMVDASDMRGHKLEPWLLELTLDDELVYRCRNERYSFHENALQRLEWTDWANTDIPREHWLHRREANILKGREGDLWYLGNDGKSLSPGDHSMALRAVDHAGNEANINWILRVQKEAQIPEETLWYSQPMGYSFGDSGSCRLTPFFSSGDPEKEGFKVMSLDPQNEDAVLESFQIWVRNVEPATFYKNAARDQGLKMMGTGIQYAAADWPIESSVPVFMPGSRDSLADGSVNSSVGVYRFKNKKGWQLVTMLADPASNNFLLEEPGLHAVFQDFKPPVFLPLKQPVIVQRGPVSSVAGVTYSRWEITPVRLIDRGSGVDTGSIKVLLDGQSLIAEPDFPRDRLLIHWPDAMTSGEHSLHIEVSDRAGNTTRSTFEIQVMEDSP